MVNLTNDPGEDSSPAWSPNGSQIAFSSNRNGFWEIYVINTDGAGFAQLTISGLANTAPAWNAAGSIIVFQTNRDGNDEIYWMTSDGSLQTNLTTNVAADGAPNLER